MAKLPGISLRNIANVNPTTLGELAPKITVGAPNTLRLHADVPAVEAARIMEENQVGLVLVFDETNPLLGIVSPNWARQRISTFRKTPYFALSQALLDMSQDPIEQNRDFHHEWLTEDRITLRRCKGGHYTVDDPCPYHEVGGD